MIGVELQIVAVDYATLVYLLEIFVPLAIVIYWLNYFYKKTQELTKKTDMLLRNQEEILKRLAPTKPEEKEGKGPDG